MRQFARLILVLAVGVLLRGAVVPCHAESPDDVVPNARGLCLLIGYDQELCQQLLADRGRLLHCLDSRADQIEKARKHHALANRTNSTNSAGRIILEHWTKTKLPHVSNIANLIVVQDSKLVDRADVQRVLQPGGTAIIRQSSGWERIEKASPDGTDDWTHQWHSPDGALTTNDERVGIPTGLQWVSGPLFAMAGRKSSTQTLVTSNGINFYVTQNVIENVGKPVESMAQFLVARDSYNGLVIWKRSWDGPFVSGKGETNPRMIASPDMLYVVAADRTIIGIDPRTGQNKARCELDVDLDKIVLHNGKLFVQGSTGLAVLNADLKETAWSYAGKNLSGLSIHSDRAFLLSSGRATDGSFQHTLICLRTDDGNTVYEVDTQPDVTAARVRINFATDKYLALQAHGFLHMFQSADGKHLWTKTTDARPGKDYVDERYVGHFLRNGLVWMLSTNSPRESDGQNLWLGLDPETGSVRRELKTTGNWPTTETPGKMGCQVLIASDRYIMIPRQATFIDFETGEKHSFKFTRGGCGLGFVPANGLLYSHPHACGCYSEAIRGFMGMHSDDIAELRKSSPAEDARLTRGQTFDGQSIQTTDNDWPVHRGNNARGAFSSTQLSRNLQQAWSVPIAVQNKDGLNNAWSLRTGNAVSAATVVGGTVFVADVNAGRLLALSLKDGKPVWEFTANGRVDTPPTIANGRCFFGSHDGYVYCLDAASGALCWKYLAAPLERRIVAFGGVESVWPVAGSTLVRNGLVYAAAGRAPDADGGIDVVALKSETGECVWRKQVSGGTFRSLCDFLVEHDDHVFLSNQRFNPNTGENETAAADSAHLQGGKVGLLEASWSKHDLALRKNIQTWTANGTSGQLLAFSADAKAAFLAEAHKLIFDADEHHELELQPGEQITSLAMTSQFLVLAGGNDRADISRGGFLKLLDLETGSVAASQPLSAEAAFDAVSLAQGCVFVATQDGYLHCFRAAKQDSVATRATDD